MLTYKTRDGRILMRKEAFASSFLDTVEQLNKMGVAVWVVKQLPPQLVYVSSALAKAQYLGRHPGNLQRTYTDIINRRSFVDAVFNETGKLYPVHFIDPVNKFCPHNGNCLIADNGQSLYIDNTHLSSYGAFWSEDMFKPFFGFLLSQ